MTDCASEDIRGNRGKLGGAEKRADGWLRPKINTALPPGSLLPQHDRSLSFLSVPQSESMAKL